MHLKNEIKQNPEAFMRNTSRIKSATPVLNTGGGTSPLRVREGDEPLPEADWKKKMSGNARETVPLDQVSGLFLFYLLTWWIRPCCCCMCVNADFCGVAAISAA